MKLIGILMKVAFDFTGNLSGWLPWKERGVSLSGLVVLWLARAMD
jgi:hypothetical protein